MFIYHPPISKAAGNATERLSGKDRFEVAVNVARKGWPSGSNKVYLVNYMAFADALAITPLAYKDDSPVLLTNPNDLTKITEDEINRLHPTEVVIAGGEGSVSSQVENKLKNMGFNVSRFGGQDRFEVASNIAQQFSTSDTAIVTNGLVFADALSIAPYASKNGIPILLTAPNQLPDSTAKSISQKQKALVIGGEGSVSPNVYNLLPADKKRIGGLNRYEVGYNIIKEFKLDTSNIYISTGLTFADALTGSVLAAKENAPLLLTAPSYIPTETKRIILEAKTNKFTILGGPASVQDNVVVNLFPVINNHTIEGYTDQISYYPGQTIQFKVHAPNSLFSMDLIRYGMNEQVMTTISNIQGHSQNYLTDAYQNGADWETTYQFTIPSDWKSGLYAAKLSDGSNQFFVSFIVKNSNSQKGDIAVLSSTNTWEAYNDWGGKSLYSFDWVGGKAYYQQIVSFGRPNPGANPSGTTGHLASGEKNILNWLESKGYHYNLFSDQDVHNNSNLLNSYKVLIISTHSEYWSTEMYNNLRAFLNRGGTLLYLSGNGVYWRAALQNGQIEVMKNGGNHTLISGKGGNFTAIGLPESSLLGVRYQSTGFSVPAPYRVVNPNHWIFQNTGVKKGDLIGVRGLNNVQNSSGGASGWETDQMDKSSSPKNTVLLAQGTNTTGKGADMVYYDHPGGGGVFSTGSITFGGSLAIDPQLTRMVQNVIDRFNR